MPMKQKGRRPVPWLPLQPLSGRKVLSAQWSHECSTTLEGMGVALYSEKKISYITVLNKTLMERSFVYFFLLLLLYVDESDLKLTFSFPP